jgi:hypothetical protein
LRHTVWITGAKCSGAQGFSSFAFGYLGKVLSQVVALLWVGALPTRPRVPKNSIRVAKLDFLGKRASFCNKRSELVLAAERKGATTDGREEE